MTLANFKEPKSTRKRGDRSERAVQKLIEKTGWTVRRQPNSGAAHGGFKSRRGDLRLRCGDAEFVCEVKLREGRPAMLQSLADGAEVLVIDGGGERVIALTEGAFVWFLEVVVELFEKEGKVDGRSA